MSTDPLMEKSAKTLLLDVPKRLFALVCKLLSLKFVVFVVATFLMIRESLPSWAWLTVAVVLILGREANKHLPALFQHLVGNRGKD